MFQFMQRYGYLLAVGGGLASRLATLVILILLPTHLGLTEYGLFVLVITIGEMIEMTSSNWYRIILIRQSVNECEARPVGTQAATGSGPARTYRFVTLAIWLCVLALIIAALVTPFFASNATQAGLTAAVAAYIVTFSFFKLVVAVLQAQKKQQLIGALEFLRGIIMIGFVAAALTWAPREFIYAASAISLAALIAGVAGLCAARSGLKGILQQSLKTNSFVTLGVPVIIATILTFQLGWIDRLILQKLLGPESIGLYVAVAAIARQPIDLLLNALNTLTFPVMMEQNSVTRRSASQRVAGILVSACILGLGCAAAIISMSEPLVQVLLSAFDSKAASVLIAPIALGALMLGLKHFVFDNIFHAHGKNWQMLKWFGIIAGATLLISLLAIPHYGVMGAALAFATGSGFALVSSCLVSRRIWSFQIPWTAIMKVAGAAVLAAGASIFIRTQFFGPVWVTLIACSLAFTLVYLLSLHILLKFSPRRFLAAPWEIDYASGVAR